jgi:pimeloyl-ACP methyl ester carboxylesterase
VLTPPAEAEAIAAALPEGAGARVERIPGAGHLPCLERPAAVTRCLADFLAMLDATSRPDAPATA